GVDVERPLPLVDAVDGTLLDAGAVHDVDAGLGDDVGHDVLLGSRVYLFHESYCRNVLMTTTQTWLPHLFHRRHNTMPRVPMPGVRGRSDVSDVVGSRPDGRPWSGDLTDHLQATSTRAPVLLADLTSPWAYLAHLRLDLD